MFKKLLPWYLLALVTLSLAFVYGCGNTTGGGGGGGGGASMVTLTGKFAAGTSTSSSGFHISTTQIKKVVIFNCNAGYWTTSVEAGVFTIEAEAGRPVGIIFAGDNGITTENGFIGYMTLGRGINSLPLNLFDGTAIDLTTIECNGGVATSENDLIEDKITDTTISTFDASAMAFGNEMFSSIIKHPDADQNDEIDILETTPRYYRPYFHYTVAGGNFPPSFITGVATVTAGTSADITNNNFCLDVSDSGGGMPETIRIYYPDLATYDATAIDGSTPTSTRRVYSIGGGNLGATGEAKDGTYEVTYDSTYGSKTLTFEITGQTATQKIALIVPTVTVNGSGKIEKINWVYKLGGSSGAEMPHPGSLVEVAQIIIWNGENPNERIYETFFTLSPNTNEHVLSPQISWDDVAYINMIYVDFYGNNVTSSWSK